MKPSLDNIRDAIQFITVSGLRYAQFREYCKANNKRPRKFNLDMKVRWNSMYTMLERCKEYEYIITLFVNTNSGKQLVTETDWLVAGHFREFLKVFYDATTILSGVYYPTSCLVIEWLWTIANAFKENRDDALLRPIIEPMQTKFLKYFQAIPHLFCFGTIMDPRRKLVDLKGAYEGIGDAFDLDFSEAYTHIHDELF